MLHGGVFSETQLQSKSTEWQQECKLLQGIGGHLCYSGINNIWLFQFVICPINDYTFFRFKQFFGRFLKYLFSLDYDRWSIQLLSTLCASFSWHVCLKDNGQNVE